MRILVINQYFHPDGASSAQLLAELCEDLVKHHDVWVVCGRPSYNVTDTVRRGGVISRERHGDIRLLRTWSTTYARSGMVGRVANYLTFLGIALVAALRAPRPDVVMTWTDPPPVPALGALVSRLRRAPFVLSYQDIVPESVVAAGELSSGIAIKGLAWARNIALRHATSVISIGEDMTRKIQELGVPRGKIQTIRNWVDGTLVRPLEGPDLFRTQMGWDDRFVVMHSGNLGMGQDQQPILDAAELLRNEPDVLFAIVGEGMRKRHWQQQVARRSLTNVEFVPFQPKENLSYSLGAADIHLVTHTLGMEGYQVPSKLYGILAAGLPCLAITAADSEVAITVEEAGCGIVCDPTDPAAIAQAIRDLRAADRGELGHRARETFEAHFDRPLATAAYDRVLSAAANGRSGGRPRHEQTPMP